MMALNNPCAASGSRGSHHERDGAGARRRRGSTAGVEEGPPRHAPCRPSSVRVDEAP